MAKPMTGQPMYVQPGMQTQPGVHATVVVGAQPMHAMPHSMPHCVRCNGTRWNPYKNCRCDYCVCYKCNGTGWNVHKNKPCKKIKIQVYSGHGGKSGKKFKKFKKFKKGFKKFKLKKLF